MALACLFSSAWFQLFSRENKISKNTMKRFLPAKLHLRAFFIEEY